MKNCTVNLSIYVKLNLLRELSYQCLPIMVGRRLWSYHANFFGRRSGRSVSDFSRRSGRTFGSNKLKLTSSEMLQHTQITHNSPAKNASRPRKYTLLLREQYLSIIIDFPDTKLRTIIKRLQLYNGNTASQEFTVFYTTIARWAQLVKRSISERFSTSVLLC